MAIEVRNLKYIYGKGSPFERTALENVSLRINDGEFLGIIGHTGSGKSTLIQHFNGLLKPSEGNVIINGIDTKMRNLKELRRQVGIVFQYPEHQLFEDTVYKDIGFGLQRFGVTSEEARLKIEEAIESVGLPGEILEKSPFELSGGQKRRVAIAGVIVMKPDILILDEPTAGLDPSGRDEILGYISRLHSKYGMTIILVSHSMEDIARFAKRVAVMNKGMISMDGTPEEVFRYTEKIEQMGLSAPQITYLMKRLKKRFPQIDSDIFTVDRAFSEIMKNINARTAKRRQ